MLQLVLDTALDGVVVMDAEGLVVDWNAQAEAIFGWRRSDAVGRQLSDLVIPEAMRDAHHQGLARFRQTGEGPLLRRRIEVSAVHRSGSEVPIELSISPVQLGENTVFLGFVRDISNRLAAQETLQERLREAELINRITVLAAGSEALDEVLRVSLATVCDLTGWPAGHAWLPTAAEPPVLRPTMIWQGDAQEFASLRAATEGLVFKAGEGLPGRIFAERTPVWFGDLSDKVAFPRGRFPNELGVRSAFGFPITAAGKVVAVLEFFSRESVEPDARVLLTVRTIGEQLGRALERARVQEHQALLLSELDHRAKNMLAVVMGMADQTARRATSIDDFQESFSARLNSLARAYGLLTARQWRSASLDEVVQEIVGPYLADGQARFEMGGPAIVLRPKAALALSLVLHELIVNATKHGSLSSPMGRLQISASAEDGPDGMLELHWRETGQVGVKPPMRTGFGTRLIEQSVKRELGGTVERTFNADGVEYRFRLPDTR